MTTQHITIQLPPYGTATLSLPKLMTPDAFMRLDSAIGEALREPGSANSTDPGAVEYHSWLVDQH